MIVHEEESSVPRYFTHGGGSMLLKGNARTRAGSVWWIDGSYDRG
jgi:hypothetical protein